jgi:hypothetical protein
LDTAAWSEFDYFPFNITLSASTLFNNKIYITGFNLDRLFVFDLASVSFSIMQLNLDTSVCKALIVDSTYMYIISSGLNVQLMNKEEQVVETVQGGTDWGSYKDHAVFQDGKFYFVAANIKS